MLERIRDVPAELFSTLESYVADFYEDYRNTVVWKLERGQTFREPGDPSWEALVFGDWKRAMRLNEEERDSVADAAARDSARSVESRRVRVVERPVSAYLQWEMHFFRLLAEAGDSIRVIDAELVRDRERVGPLPEVVVVGRKLFEVIYDDAGTATGARRVDDPEIVAACRDEIASLHAQGEPVLDYFAREIAPLSSPAI